MVPSSSVTITTADGTTSWADEVGELEIPFHLSLSEINAAPVSDDNSLIIGNKPLYRNGPTGTGQVAEVSRRIFRGDQPDGQITIIVARERLQDI